MIKKLNILDNLGLHFFHDFYSIVLALLDVVGIVDYHFNQIRQRNIIDIPQ